MIRNATGYCAPCAAVHGCKQSVHRPFGSIALGSPLNDFLSPLQNGWPAASLDDAGANRTFLFVIPTQAERLANYFIECAGIAAVYVDAGGLIGAVDSVGIEPLRDRILVCCAAGRQHTIAAAAAARAERGAGQAASLAALRSAAAEGGVGLTPHQAVVQRALAAVEAVDQRIAELQRTGGMKELNTEFKAARKAGSFVRYRDLLHANKLTMLEVIAGKTGRRRTRRQRIKPLGRHVQSFCETVAACVHYWTQSRL
jgi:hypothetical protein